MSRIVIDAREWSTSTGRYISNLVYNLEKTDSQNNYTVLLSPKDMAAWQPTNPKFQKIICPYKEFTFAEQIGYKRQLNGLKADLVHFGMAQQPAFYGGNSITTMNDLTTLRFRNLSKNLLIFKSKQLVYRWLNKRVAKKSAAIITYSQFVKDDVANFAHIDPGKITVTPLAAIKMTVLPEPVDLLVNKPFLLYVGRPMSHKNLERLAEAFKQLKDQRPELNLVLAGKKDANYAHLEKFTQELAVKDVVFTDFVSEGQLRWLYENCRAYVFPSLSEGFGLPGLEAMAQGAPVVSSNATCLPEVYGDAAHYFDPLSVPAMAAAINDLLSNDKLRAELIKNGGEQVKKYSWQKTAEQTLAIYNKALRSS